jgi:hypothetical protein
MSDNPPQYISHSQLANTPTSLPTGWSPGDLFIYLQLITHPGVDYYIPTDYTLITENQFYLNPDGSQNKAAVAYKFAEHGETAPIVPDLYLNDRSFLICYRYVTALDSTSAWTSPTNTTFNCNPVYCTNAGSLVAVLVILENSFEPNNWNDYYPYSYTKELTVDPSPDGIQMGFILFDTVPPLSGFSSQLEVITAGPLTPNAAALTLSFVPTYIPPTPPAGGNQNFFLLF